MTLSGVYVHQMRTRTVVFAIVACSLTDCVRFHPMPGPPAAVVRQLDSENAVVITTKSGDEVRLANVRVDGDSLIGVRSVASMERVAIAVADVESVAVARSDVSGTALAIGATAGVALLVFLVHILMSSD